MDRGKGQGISGTYGFGLSSMAWNIYLALFRFRTWLAALETPKERRKDGCIVWLGSDSWCVDIALLRTNER